MRLRASLIALLVLGAVAALMPILSAELPPLPIRMHAFAINMTNVATGTSGVLDITIDKWSTEDLRGRLVSAMVDKGQDGLLDVLRKAPIIGRIRIPGWQGPDPQNYRLGWDLRYARDEKLPDGGDRITIGTDRLMSMLEIRNRPRSYDYPLLLMQIVIPKEGKGEGRMFAATQIQFDKKKNSIEFEQFLGRRPSPERNHRREEVNRSDSDAPPAGRRRAPPRRCRSDGEAPPVLAKQTGPRASGNRSARHAACEGAGVVGPIRMRIVAAVMSVLVSAQAVGTLDQLLAPVALYPDPLLAQILMSAGDPAKVTELDRWLKSNQSLKGSALQDAAVKAAFEPSFVALAIFPQVVAEMAANIDRTRLLGQVFVADRASVFASIQKLRHQAQSVGTLKSTPQQSVSSQTTAEGQDVIVIESTNPQVVYVPQYNSQVVYTQAPAATTTVVVHEDNTDAAVAAGLIGFTAGIAIGAAVNNSYYYGPYGWHGGGYMYNDAWDDYYDHREDAREDWQDHREDLVEERGDRAENRSEQGTDRRQTTQEQRTDRTESRQENRPNAQTQSATQQRTGSPEARGYSDTGSRGQAVKERSGGSDAFSGYSNGKSERSSSSRGNTSRSSSSRSRGGGGRRR